MTLLNHYDGYEFYNYDGNGFTEWCKVVDCQIQQPKRSAFRFRRGSAATASFHGVEIMDCWTNLAASAPSAVRVGNGCWWYNGTCRLRVFFASGLSAPQYVFTSEPVGAFPNHPVQVEGALKCEGGNGWGVGADFTVPYDFLGPIMSHAGMRYGGLRPQWYTMNLGQEAGMANGVNAALAQPFSIGPRAITVDSTGHWKTPIRVDGDQILTTTFSANLYEFRGYGLVRQQGYGQAGRYHELDGWMINNQRGFNAPVISVDSNGDVWVTNANYPAGEVQFCAWTTPLSLGVQQHLKYATMAD